MIFDNHAILCFLLLYKILPLRVIEPHKISFLKLPVIGPRFITGFRAIAGSPWVPRRACEQKQRKVLVPIYFMSLHNFLAELFHCSVKRSTIAFDCGVRVVSCLRWRTLHIPPIDSLRCFQRHLVVAAEASRTPSRSNLLECHNMTLGNHAIIVSTGCLLHKGFVSTS